LCVSWRNRFAFFSRDQLTAVCNIIYYYYLSVPRGRLRYDNIIYIIYFVYVVYEVRFWQKGIYSVCAAIINLVNRVAFMHCVSRISCIAKILIYGVGPQLNRSSSSSSSDYPHQKPNIRPCPVKSSCLAVETRAIILSFHDDFFGLRIYVSFSQTIYLFPSV